jgi:hypothetical protein
MALIDLDICNMALSALGIEDSLSSLSEVGVAAEQCNRWYGLTRDLVLRVAPWNSAKAYSRLALLSERDNSANWVATDPEPGYLYAYALPSDFIWPRYFSDYTRFTMGFVGDSPALMTNTESPILFYTKRQEQVQLWDVGLQHSVAYTLAARIAKRLTGKDSDLQNMFALANELVNTARAENANAQMDQLQESIPDWISARGYGGSSPLNRFVFPPAAFTLSGVNSLG